ncbi:MAG TPA: ABC transporter substrate-binding protein [Bryobacteraceae bacterium]|nr:ABC transporter substrate-binding protein [Bryobacteraceae bacterium]
MRRCAILVLLIHSVLSGQWGGELRLSLRNDPRTFDPALVDEIGGETIRYLTGGVLVRLHRVTQKPQAELAESWKVLDGGRRLEIRVRQGVLFSDGTPFTARDVAFTFRRLMDPALRSPTADAFRSGAGQPTVNVTAPYALTIVFPAPVAAIDRLLDQVAIQSEKSALKEKAVLGPFMLAEHQAGSFVLLKRNPNYWKKEGTRRLPYLDSLRLEILTNRDLELLKLRRGELHMLDSIDPENFERLRADQSLVTTDAGPSTDVEMLWFNQSGTARLPSWKSEWFRSRAFRQAMSSAINRADLVRVVYKGFAQASAGPLPPGTPWYNTSVKAHAFDPASARKKLEQAGFRYQAQKLIDSSGHPVEFSIITNAGNKQRARMSSLIQQDLRKIGVEVNIVPLDWASLIERITKTLDYEACLVGLVNVDPDPNGQMNVWLSSGANHQWNPGQTTPSTSWEREIDVLMRRQAAAADFKTRKQAFDKVQQIVSEEVPFIYLTHRNALTAVSASMRRVVPSQLRPHLVWDIEHIGFQQGANARTTAAR